jgi:methylated-DNA-[protein]-cysteine S-methyltransferase
MTTAAHTEPDDRLLAALAAVDRDRMQRLHDRLVDAATTNDLLDVAYRTLDTPLGSLLLAATEAGLVRIAYACEGHDRVLEQLTRTVSPRVLRASKPLEPAVRQIMDYFARRRTTFELPLDLRLAHGFRRTVLEHLPEIRYGTTASYASVAATAGNPKAVRAVGTACATNPLPLVVPCHRVVRSDGSPGLYLAGVDAKRALLALEGAA